MSTTLRNKITGSVILPKSITLKDTITGKVYSVTYWEWQLLKTIVESKCKDRSWRHCPEHRAELIALLEEAIKASK